MEEEDEANNFTSGHLHTAMSDVETSMSREETSSDDSSDESGDHESNGNNDDPFNSIDKDDMATLNSVTSYLGLAAYTRRLLWTEHHNAGLRSVDSVPHVDTVPTHSRSSRRSHYRSSCPSHSSSSSRDSTGSKYSSMSEEEFEAEAQRRGTLYYEIDSQGASISNAKGKRVISHMHELMWIYFPDDILTDWRRQPRDSKQAVIDLLHREFLNPEGHRFKEKAMLSFMNHVLKSRRGMARAALFDGSLKPPRISSDDWRRVREEWRTYPNRWDQQREANRVQRSTTGIARLGSGGKAHFMAKFKEVVGRAPTEAEYMEGRDNSLGALLERMRRDGIAFTPRPEQRPGLSDHAIAPDVEMDAEEEDQSYVPSNEEETKDEVMESNNDQDIWLQDVEHPTSSGRPKGREGERAPECLKKDCFLAGLYPILREKIKVKFPDTFEKAMAYAREKDRKLKFQAQLQGGMEPPPSAQPIARTIVGTSATDQESSQQELLQQITNQLESLSINLVQGVRASQSGNDRNCQEEQRQTREYVCYNCGEVGHGMYFCSHPRCYQGNGNHRRAPRQQVTPPRARPPNGQQNAPVAPPIQILRSPPPPPQTPAEIPPLPSSGKDRDAQLHEVKKKLDSLKQRLDGDFQASECKFEVLWRKLLEVAAAQNSDYSKLCKFMERLHEDAREKVEVDGPTTYADAMAYARGRTKKLLKKRQVSQGMLSAVGSKSVEAVAVKTQPMLEGLPVEQEEPRVLWLQRYGVTSMPRIPTKEVQVMEDPFKSMDEVENSQACSGNVCQISLGSTREQRVRFVDKLEEILDLETKEEMEAHSSSSMDTDTSWETESSYSRYEEVDVLHVDRVVKEDVLKDHVKLQEDLLDVDLMKEAKPTNKDMQLVQSLSRKDEVALLVEEQLMCFMAHEEESPAMTSSKSSKEEYVPDAQLHEVKKKLDSLKQRLDGDFEAFECEFEVLCRKLLEVTAAQNSDYSNLCKFMERQHEDVREKVEVDGPTTYADAMAYARTRTNKLLKKRQVSQGMLSAVGSKSVEAVAVKTQPMLDGLPVEQEEPRVLWLQRDGVTSMQRIPTKEVVVKEDVLKDHVKLQEDLLDAYLMKEPKPTNEDMKKYVPDAQLHEVKKKLDSLKQRLDGDFQAFECKFEVLWTKMLEVTVAQNSDYSKLCKFMERLHEDVREKVEVDGPTTYADAMAYARCRTKKLLKKRQVSQDKLEEILDLERKEEMEANSSSSMDTDTSWETESSYSRYEEVDVLHVDRVVKEDVLKDHVKLQEDLLDADLMKEPKPTNEDMQVKVICGTLLMTMLVKMTVESIIVV
ncbi:hypothetical protein L7F22_057105 [Adiantum nelumboides]|nr:hypothetical protein [Adiantum nelumboides]